MSDDVKLCPYCGKKLRSDNKRGACSDCLASGRGRDEAPSVDLGDGPPKKRSKASDVVKRFRVVAEALGFDADQLLEEYCAGWLENIKQKATEG